MAAPTLQDFKAIVNKPEYSIGTKIVNTYVRLPILLYKLGKYITVDGTLSADVDRDICAISCEDPDEEEETETT